MPGHVHVVRGDLTALACDAVLVPSDRAGQVTVHWQSFLADLPLSSPNDAGWVTPEVDLPLDYRLGKARTTPLPPCRRVPARWLTDTAVPIDQPVEWLAAGAVEFVESAAAHVSPAGGRSRPLLGVPAVGTGAGGAAGEAGEVLRVLLPALWRAAASNDVDVVLVTRGPTVYAAAQWARRRELEDRQLGAADHWHLDEPLIDSARALAAQAQEGRLVFFVGSGVSQGAGLPGWQELLDALAHRCGLDEQLDALHDLDVLDQARLIRSRLPDLAAAIRSELSAEQPALAHYLLASLPAREMVTTNYDELLERACAAADDPVDVLPYERTGRDRWLLKLHGSISSAADDIVLTREDYLRYTMRRGALAGIVQALLITRHMLFTGFGLEDDNFHRIADEVRQAIGTATSEPFGTALTLLPHPLRQQLWTDELDFVVLGTPESVPLEAARRHDRFLDLLGSEATTNAAHLLNDAYDGVLDENEREVRTALLDLVAGVPRQARASPAWQPVNRLLTQLGLTDAS